ncbi:MAG: hypothetical protein KJS64_07680 [Acidobacteria bacterium]|nr:hypothetical protein [Acidobacteriota bacterium]
MRLKSFATWIGAIVSGGALAVAAAVVTSGSIPAPQPVASLLTSTTVVSSPSTVPVRRSTTTMVREDHVVVPTTNQVSVSTTVPSYSEYEEDEHHWGERRDEWGNEGDD